MKINKKTIINVAIYIGLMVGIGLIPASEPITQVGMRVIGILTATIFAWCAMDLIWPSFVALVLVGLSGSLLCQQQRYADLNCGTGMMVMGLAAVIVGQVLFGNRGIATGIISAVVGSLAYRLIIQIAYKLDMPSYTVKLLSALIVALALAVPILRKSIVEAKDRTNRKKAAAKEG